MPVDPKYCKEMFKEIKDGEIDRYIKDEWNGDCHMLYEIKNKNGVNGRNHNMCKIGIFIKTVIGKH